MWIEVEIVQKENKRELALTGATVSERIENSGLDKHIFTLTFVNFLNISDTCLDNLPDDISNLTNLQSLLLYSNKLTSLPVSIAKLDKLKLLDISRNELTEVPAEIASMPTLVTLNLSSNKIATFPSLEHAVKLAVLDLSNNALETFPNICHKTLVNLAEVKLNGNNIDAVSDDIIALPSLKVLNLSKNYIKKVPKALANIHKLKELNMLDNPLADKRLLKLVQQNAKMKQIVDYVKQNGAPPPVKEAKQVDDVANNSSTETILPAEPNVINVMKSKIKVIRAADDGIKVIYQEAVRSVRPHILCCIVTGISLADHNLRRFLQAQSKLHDTVCGKRESSTIATHDLTKLKDYVFYTALDPNSLFITPLGYSNSITGKQYYNKLRNEAENARKEKKRSVLSGIHKYLYLLDNKDRYACLTTSTEEVISVPPLTNSDVTKMTHTTKSLLFEVTSGNSLGDCKVAMEHLIKEALILGLGDDVDNSDTNLHTLTVHQVRVCDEDGNLKNVYPSRTDLNFPEIENIVVERE